MPDTTATCFAMDMLAISFWLEQHFMLLERTTAVIDFPVSLNYHVELVFLPLLQPTMDAEMAVAATTVLIISIA